MTKTIQLLIIEDDKEDALLVKEALRELRLVTTVKSTLAGGLSALPGKDIVLLDLGLPDSEGLAGLVKIRQTAPKTPVIVLTGGSDEAVGREAMLHGADDFLNKGQLATRSLERVVEYAIERRLFQEHASKVAALKRKNKLLARSESAHRDFIANFSHELRTPIATISGFAETLLDVPPGRKTLRDSFLKIMHKQARKLSWLISDFLSLSEIESGHAKLHLEELAIGEFLSDCVDDFSLLLKKKKVKVILQAPRRLSVKADKNYLALVIHNLLDNAVKHSAEKGRVELRALEAGTSLRIEVQDHGRGIPAKELPRIFDRFYRGSRDRAAGMKGAGIGLSLVKSIIELHGGSVSAASRPGKATTFSVRLPR